jgi:hypothetical protein
MKILCLGYMDEKKWETMSKSEQEAFMKECCAFDEFLKKNGYWVYDQALQSVRTARTLRCVNGKIVVTDGPYAETKEQLGGVVVFEFQDMNQALEVMLQHPAIRRGVNIELRPAEDCPGAG